MTKKLEELLNLPENEEIVQAAEAQETEQKNYDEQIAKKEKRTYREFEELDKITAALPQVSGLGDKADEELDDIAKKAMDTFEDLKDLGMNVESRYSARVFEVAGNMLKTSLDAKSTKIDKKLKMLELQIKKEKQDKEGSNNNGDVVNGEGYVVTDRNSLLERLKGMDKDK